MYFTQTLEVVNGFDGRASINGFSLMEQCEVVKEPEDWVTWLVDRENDSSTTPGQSEWSEERKRAVRVSDKW